MSEGLTLPFNQEAERSTLASVLLEPDAIVPIAAWLKPDDFYLERNGAVYAAMLECYRTRQRPDVTKVMIALRKAGAYDVAGGALYLAELSNEGGFHAVDVEHYAREVKRNSALRKVIEAAGKIRAQAYRTSDDADTFAANAQALLMGAVKIDEGRGGLEPIGGILEEWITAIEDGVPPGTSSGFVDYDDATGGIHPADLIILAARPAVGKSSLAQQLACNVAGAGHRVDFFSIEMDRTQLIERMIAQQSGVALSAIRHRRLDDEQKGMIAEAALRLRQLPLYVDERPQTMASLRNKVLQNAAQHGPAKLIIIDYLQRIKPDTGNRYYNRTQEVGQISSALKELAKETRATVLAISSLSRQVEQRTGKVPELGDLRESGDIEYDADLVAFLHREEVFDKTTEKKGIAEIHIAKHRNGPLKVVPLRFEDTTTRFDNIAPNYRAPEGY